MEIESQRKLMQNWLHHLHQWVHKRSLRRILHLIKVWSLQRRNSFQSYVRLFFIIVEMRSLRQISWSCDLCQNKFWGFIKGLRLDLDMRRNLMLDLVTCVKTTETVCFLPLDLRKMWKLSDWFTLWIRELFFTQVTRWHQKLYVSYIKIWSQI